MSRGIWRQAPALVVAAVALVAALAGTVYAAGKINGHAVKGKSLPGNRLALPPGPGQPAGAALGAGQSAEAGDDSEHAAGAGLDPGGPAGARVGDRTADGRLHP